MTPLLSLRRLACAALLLLLPAAVATVEAQKLKLEVANFQLDAFDGTARNTQYSRTDGNGDLFAIVKVTSNSPNDDLSAYTFNFGNMRHEVDADHDGELWLYVQRNARLVTITREGYTTVNKYDLRPAIEAGRTYVLQLNAQQPRVERRILQFNVRPLDIGAVVRVKREGASGDYQLWGIVDANGSRAQRIETGTWLYEVTADNYQPSRGRVTLTKGNGPQEENVRLEENFGHLEVIGDGTTDGAEIFVDNKPIGTVPYSSKEPMAVGEHHVTIIKGELYKQYNATVTIQPGETTRLTPRLQANFAETTITVDADADIYIDGELMGHRTWRGPLKAGAYTVECRQKDCRPTVRQIAVAAGLSETFAIDAPKPITGALSIISYPLRAKVFLDGQQEGRTPLELDSLPIGTHQVQLAMEGYKTVTRTVDIAEGADEELNVTLESVKKQKAEPKPKQEPKPKPDKPQQPKQKSDKTATGAHIQAALQVGSLMGLDLGAGLHLGNIAVEASYLLGLSKSDAVYWNYDTDTTPEEAVYKTSALALRLGYAIPMGSLSLTPQVGARLLMVGSESGNSKCNATSATLGLRADYRLAKAVSLFAAPEMAFAVSKSDIYTQVADVASDVKGWGTGFNVRIGLSINF